MNSDVDPLLMGTGTEQDTSLFRALYHLGTLVAERSAAPLEPEEDDEGYAPTFPELPVAAWSVVGVEPWPFAKFLEQHAVDTWWGLLQFTEQPGGMLVCLDHATARTLVGLPDGQPLTDEHFDAVDEVVRRISAAVSEVWADIVSDAANQHGTFPEAPDLEELREVFTVLAPATTMFATSFRIRVPARPLGRVHLLVPQPYLTPYADSLQAAAENTFVRDSGESSDERLRYLGDVPVPIVALLGRAEMTVSDLHGLEEEDVILLDQVVSDPIQILVGGGARLMGMPGTGPDGSRRAVQITRLGDE